MSKLLRFQEIKPCGALEEGNYVKFFSCRILLHSLYIYLHMYIPYIDLKKKEFHSYKKYNIYVVFFLRLSLNLINYCRKRPWQIALPFLAKLTAQLDKPQ